MTRVAIVRAKGDAGFQDPSNGLYISSKRDTIVPYTAFVESLVNHDKVDAKEVLENSNFEDFVGYIANNDGDYDKALEAYRPTVTGDNTPEPVEKPANVAEAIAPAEDKPRANRAATRTREQARADKEAE